MAFGVERAYGDRYGFPERELKRAGIVGVEAVRIVVRFVFPPERYVIDREARLQGQDVHERRVGGDAQRGVAGGVGSCLADVHVIGAGGDPRVGDGLALVVERGDREFARGVEGELRIGDGRTGALLGEGKKSL
jgi:hypothetical protein